MTDQDLYPRGPKDVPAELTQPTATYKHAWLALASLALFVALYIALAGWFVWTAYRMFGEAAAGGPDKGWHLLISVSAAFLAVFMLKALFFIQRGGAPDAVEVTAAEQPRLFAFLHRLADEAGAPRPKRVYLSARVNAAVFYDLSILNLLFPSAELEIGLALVNADAERDQGGAGARVRASSRSARWRSALVHRAAIAAHIVAKRDALDEFIGWCRAWTCASHGSAGCCRWSGRSARSWTRCSGWWCWRSARCRARWNSRPTWWRSRSPAATSWCTRCTSSTPRTRRGGGRSVSPNRRCAKAAFHTTCLRCKRVSSRGSRRFWTMKATARRPE